MKPISGTWPVEDARILVYNVMIKRRNRFCLRLYDLHEQSVNSEGNEYTKLHLEIYL
jgi:hypothetical protein